MDWYEMSCNHHGRQVTGPSTGFKTSFNVTLHKAKLDGSQQNKTQTLLRAQYKELYKNKHHHHHDMKRCKQL